MVQWQGWLLFLLGFEIPSFVNSKGKSFCLKFETYGGIFQVTNFHDLIKR